MDHQPQHWTLNMNTNTNTNGHHTNRSTNMNENTNTANTIDLTDAISDLCAVMRDLERCEVDELVEVEWNGCENGNDVAERIDALNRSRVEDLEGDINELAARYSGIDDDEMAKQFVLGVDDIDNLHADMQTTISCVIDTLRLIAEGQTGSPALDTNRTLNRVADFVGEIRSRDSQARIATQRPLSPEDDASSVLERWKRGAVAKVWEEVLGMAERMFDDILPDNQ